jgi:hypothetical protein
LPSQPHSGKGSGAKGKIQYTLAPPGAVVTIAAMPKHFGTCLAFIILLAVGIESRAASADYDLFVRTNLLAWCIVPFDAKKRGPEDRAEMMEKLGIRRFAYDYRAEHVPTFDAEIAALKKRNIELTAWWFPTSLNGEARHILTEF